MPPSYFMVIELETVTVVPGPGGDLRSTRRDRFDTAQILSLLACLVLMPLACSAPHSPGLSSWRPSGRRHAGHGAKAPYSTQRNGTSIMPVEMNSALADVDIELDRDVFLRSLIRELVGSLESVVGIEDASGYISVVGLAIGDSLNREYRRALDVSLLDGKQVAAVLVDLKRRIEGNFYIVEQSDTHIVLGNTACPFGDKVKGRPSLCMMTSNVFGHITAQNLGYAKVSLEETIASGHAGCRVTIRLQPGDEHEGREYFSAGMAE